MSLKCKIGLHSWRGCKCYECGKIRDEQHDWYICKCSRCGKTRDDNHSWIGCKCYRCGVTRDEGHKWIKETENCTKCKECGKKREHNWLTNCEKCSNCGAERKFQHDWKNNCEKCSKCESRRIDAHTVVNYQCSVCGKNVLNELLDLIEKEGTKENEIKFITNVCKEIGKLPEGMLNEELKNRFDNLFADTFYHLITFNAMDVIKFLVQNGANINPQESRKYRIQSPLKVALENYVWSREIAIFLIENGVDINFLLDYRNSPLNYCIEKGDFEIAELLIKRGVDVNQIGWCNKTPITTAIEYIDEIKNTNIIKLLINNWADLSVRDSSDNTPLHFVDKIDSNTPSYYKEMYEILIDHGADLYAENSAGFIPSSTNLPENDMRLILMKLKSIIKRGDASKFQYKSESEEFNQIVNKYFELVQNCTEYNSHTESWQATSKHSSGTYNIREKPEEVSKLASFNTPVSNNILHLLQEIESINITVGWTCDIADKSTLNFWEVKNRAREELQKRDNPAFDKSVFLDKSNY
jgi:ankyrin repeat protein